MLEVVPPKPEPVLSAALSARPEPVSEPDFSIVVSAGPDEVPPVGDGDGDGLEPPVAVSLGC